MDYLEIAYGPFFMFEFKASYIRCTYFFRFFFVINWLVTAKVFFVDVYVQIMLALNLS